MVVPATTGAGTMSMGYYDARVSEVTVVLKDLPDGAFPGAVEKLKAAGLVVEDTFEDSGVVEGMIDAYKVEDLRKLAEVQYVRVEMTYDANYPPGDPRDTNKR
jgi:hypothetical protein